MKVKKRGGMLESEDGKVVIGRNGIYLPSPDYLRPEAVSAKGKVTKRPATSRGSKKKRP